MKKSETLTLLKEILSQLEEGKNADLPLINLFSSMDEMDVLAVILKQLMDYTERFITYFSKDEWPVKRVEALARYIRGQDEEYLEDLTGSIWDDFYDIPACHAFFMGIYNLEAAITHKKENNVFIEFAVASLECIINARVREYWSVKNKQEWEYWEQMIQTPLSDVDLQKIALGEINMVIPTIPEYVQNYRKDILLEIAKEIKILLLNSM